MSSVLEVGCNCNQTNPIVPIMQPWKKRYYEESRFIIKSCGENITIPVLLYSPSETLPPQTQLWPLGWASHQLSSCSCPQQRHWWRVWRWQSWPHFYWAAARHSRRQLYQHYSQLDTRIWSPWTWNTHDQHHEYGSHGSLTGFLTCFSIGSCVLAVIILNLNTIVVKFIDIIFIIIIIIFGLTRSELVRHLIGRPLAVLHYCWAGQGRKGWRTWQKRWSCHPP